MSKVETVYVVGESRTNGDNAITKIYNSFYLTYEVNLETDEIVDFSCTHTVDLTERFLSKLFVGRNMIQLKDTLETELNLRYGGSSKKAILVAYLDALKRYRVLKDANQMQQG